MSGESPHEVEMYSKAYEVDGWKVSVGENHTLVEERRVTTSVPTWLLLGPSWAVLGQENERPEYVVVSLVARACEE